MVAVVQCYDREKKLISLLTILNYYMFILLFFMFKIYNSCILFFNRNFVYFYVFGLLLWLNGFKAPLQSLALRLFLFIS